MTAKQLILTVLAIVVLGGAVLALQGGGIGVSADPVACDAPPVQETSADFLKRTAHCLFSDSAAPEDRLRLALINDIYIKSWSYAVLNKVCFWLSVGLALLVLVYPALGPIFKADASKPEGNNWFQRAISTASVQTSITALAAASFAFYAHYKEQQSQAETLMRELLVRETVDAAYLESVVRRTAQMDKGFGFATTTTTGE